MKRSLSAIPVAAVLALASAVPAASQDQAPFTVITTYDVKPADAATFEQAVATFKRAAEQANLASEYGWNMWQLDSRYVITGSRKSMASFDDPNFMLSQFQGTPGQAALEEAFAVYGSIDVGVHSEVHMDAPEWSYMPANPAMDEAGMVGVMVFEDWVPFGNLQAFDQNTRELIAALAEMDFPYPVIGSRVVIGDNDKAAFVVVHDGLPGFYGENNIQTFIESAGMAEAWAKLIEARMGLMRRTASYPATHRPDLSYNPEM